MWTLSKQMSELEESQNYWPFWNPTKEKNLRNVQKLRSSSLPQKVGGKVVKKVGEKVGKKVEKEVGEKVEKKVGKKVEKKIGKKVEKKVWKKT